MNRVLILCLAVLFLTTTLPADEFTNFKNLSDDEVIIHSTGKHEMRMDDEAVKKTKEWDFLDSNGKPSTEKQEALYDYIEEHRASSYQTMLNPLFVAGLVDSGTLVSRTYSGRINGLRFGPEKEDEDIDEFLNDAGLEKVSDTEFKKGSDTYAFKNVVINYYFQKVYKTEEGESGRAEWGSSSFGDKYEKVTRDVGDFTLKSDISNPAYSPPGDVAFDAGVNDDETEQPLEASQGANETGEDYTMEVFVELTGEVHKNGALFEKFEEMGEKPIGRSAIYVEDYIPPLPEELGAIEVQSNSEALAPKGDSNGNAFIPGMARFYDGDGSGYNVSGINPRNSLQSSTIAQC